MELRRNYQDILDRGVDVVAISVDPPQASEALRRRLELPMRFLSDSDGALFDALNVRDTNGRPPAWLLPPGWTSPAASRDIFLPATFLVDVPDAPGTPAVVRWVYRPDTYRVRATPGAVLAAIDTTARTP
ncbi:MAG: peroxiredoxin family protein [Caldilineaceae bacterium]|nr:peroxiredoxin family protein [Caldilineaceae bacterium]